MTKRVKRIINSVAVVLFIFVLIDHFLAFIYQNFIKDSIHTDLSLYIEIVSVVFTISVPFFYAQYQRRENKIEELALKNGGTTEDLKKVRETNDIKSIVYYSLMFFFVILLAFVQSNIIISSQMKTSDLQSKVENVQLSLTSTKTELNVMVERLSRLDSVLSQIAFHEKSDGDVKTPLLKALDELKEIHTLTSNIESTISKANNFTNFGGDRNSKKSALDESEDFSKLELKMLDLGTELKEMQNLYLSTSKSQYEKIENKIKFLTNQISNLQAIPDTEEPIAKTSITDKEIKNLFELTAKYYDDFIASYGNESLYEKRVVLERFTAFTNSKGISISDVKIKLTENKNLMDQFINTKKNSSSLKISNLYNKVKWLSWLNDNLSGI